MYVYVCSCSTVIHFGGWGVLERPFRRKRGRYNVELVSSHIVRSIGTCLSSDLTSWSVSSVARSTAWEGRGAAPRKKRSSRPPAKRSDGQVPPRVHNGTGQIIDTCTYVYTTAAGRKRPGGGGRRVPRPPPKKNKNARTKINPEKSTAPSGFTPVRSLGWPDQCYRHIYNVFTAVGCMYRNDTRCRPRADYVCSLSA